MGVTQVLRQASDPRSNSRTENYTLVSSNLRRPIALVLPTLVFSA